MAALLSGAAIIAQEPTAALSRLSVASMRSRPSHSSEQVSQALMGTPVEILERGKEWSRVRTPDGYEGWMINHSLAFPDVAGMARWSEGPLEMVTTPYELHDSDGRTDLVSGDILLSVGDSLELPDGRRILRPTGSTTPLADLTAKPFKPSELPRRAALYMGVPYQWGGLSSKGMDCSGLVRMVYAAQGRLLPRDAWQQAVEGEEVPADSLRAGDLIFFGNPKTGKVTHVAIYEGNNRYVHSSQLVRRNSLNPQDPDYLPLNILARRRISGTPMSN